MAMHVVYYFINGTPWSCRVCNLHNHTQQPWLWHTLVLHLNRFLRNRGHTYSSPNPLIHMGPSVATSALHWKCLSFLLFTRRSQLPLSWSGPRCATPHTKFVNTREKHQSRSISASTVAGTWENTGVGGNYPTLLTGGHRSTGTAKERLSTLSLLYASKGFF